MIQHWRVHKNFYPKAQHLREYFDLQFANPLESRPERFVWDYWNVPNQYRLMRTPAQNYFPAKIFNPFLDHLVSWGRTHLGCHSVSPLWMSYYVDGCYQNWHSDVPHGPWAFVFSLSPRKIKYQGGKTNLFRPEVLSYWSHFSESVDRERDSFIKTIPSPFNQLTVFDPRLPHSVERVTGVDDPRDARLVLHGWFVEPRPFVTGSLSTRAVGKPLEGLMRRLGQESTQWGRLHGTLCLRLKIKTSGKIGKIEILTDTVIGSHSEDSSRLQFLTFLQKEIDALFFPSAKGESILTLPILFK